MADLLKGSKPIAWRIQHSTTMDGVAIAEIIRDDEGPYLYVVDAEDDLRKEGYRRESPFKWVVDPDAGCTY